MLPSMRLAGLAKISLSALRKLSLSFLVIS
jgi:hypothetical protein